MSRDLNKCFFIGRLGKDPEIRSMPNGTACANFSIACGDDYKAKDGTKVERTEWIPISAFGPLAEIISKYVFKGSKIHIEGKFTTRKWQDKDGKDCYKTEIVASEMQMLDGKQSGDQGQQAPRQKQASPAEFAEFDDGEQIPF